MESERKEEIIKYLDKYGVPYHSLAVFGLIFETEDENDFIARIKRESDKRIERTLKVGECLMHKLKPTTKNEPVLNEFFDFNILKEDEMIKVQLKGRFTINKKYEGKDIYIAFRENDKNRIYKHDDAVNKIPEHTRNSKSWKETGLYSWNKTPESYNDIITELD